MKVFGFLLLVALAISAEAGMMGGPAGFGKGPGGPPGGPGMGPPPFVQQIIASKGKPFGAGGAAGGPPGAMAGGPPPFVQSIIASKGKPFGGAPAASAPQPTAFDPASLGPPDYVQSLMAAKAAAGLPFVPSTIPLGPPPFIQQLIAAKNAAAAQQAAEEAALAQQLAQQNLGRLPLHPFINPPFGNGIVGGSHPDPAIFHNILAQNGFQIKNAQTAALIQQFIQAQIAKNSLCRNHTGFPSPIGVGMPEEARPEPVGLDRFYSGINSGGVGNYWGLAQQQRNLYQGNAYNNYNEMQRRQPFGFPPFPPARVGSPMPYPMMPFHYSHPLSG